MKRLNITKECLMMLNFDKLKELQVAAFEDQLAELQDSCKDPDIAEFVSYIVAFGSEQSYATRGSYEASLGRDIIQHIWQISGMGLSGIGNSVHFELSWVSILNSFIGNYFLDDSAFKLKPFDSTFEFEASGSCDAGNEWCQNPRVIIEAAKANRAYYDKCDELGMFQAMKQKVEVDRTKVMELLK